MRLMTLKVRYKFENHIIIFSIFMLVCVAFEIGFLIKGVDTGSFPIVIMLYAIIGGLFVLTDIKDIKTKIISRRGKIVEGKIICTTDHRYGSRFSGCRLVVAYGSKTLITPYMSYSYADNIASEECSVWVNGDYAYAGKIRYKFWGKGIKLPHNGKFF